MLTKWSVALLTSIWNTASSYRTEHPRALMFGKTLLILGSSHSTPDLYLEDEWQDLLSDYTIINQGTPDEALATIRNEQVDCVLVLDSAASEEPVGVLETIHVANPNVPVVFRCTDITAFTAVRLIHAGAAHCLDSRDSIARLRDTLETSVIQKRLDDKVRLGASQASEPWRSFLIGESSAMEAVAEKIRLVGPRRCTVLITGETGTGKEMAARALHMASPRSKHEMVAVNCSA